MPKFRKKPVEIEARQFNEECANLGPLMDWLGEDGDYKICAVDGPVILIDTLEGQMKARPGDWIIKGVNHEFSVSNPKCFAESYEEVGK